jgi:hypothetical protein
VVKRSELNKALNVIRRDFGVAKKINIAVLDGTLINQILESASIENEKILNSMFCFAKKKSKKNGIRTEKKRDTDGIA